MDLKIIAERAAFADIEASGLMDGGFPVEVAWRMRDSTGDVVIMPSPDWDLDAWDSDAEGIHGLSRDDLQSEGRAPVDVAALLNDVFAGKMVYTDFPEQDASWFDMLHEAAGIPRRYRIISISRILSKMGFDAETSEPLFAMAKIKSDPRGRASNGVKHLSTVFSMALKERMS